MTNSYRRLFSFIVLVGLWIIPAQAQFSDSNGPIKIEKVESEMTMPPSLGTVGRSRGSARDGKWLAVYVTYSVTPEEGDFLDEAQFKVMVEGEDAKPGEKQGLAVLLTAEDTFLLLPKGREAMVAFFLHPSVVERFGGESKLDRKNIHAEAYVKGQMVSAADKKKEEDPNWFSPVRKISGFIQTKSESPWSSTEAGKFPLPKLK